MSEPSRTTRDEMVVDTFVHLADTLVEHYDVIEFLGFLCERCVQLVPIDETAVMLASPGGRLQVMAGSSERSRVLELFELQNSDGPCLDAYRSGRSVSGDDLRIQEQASRWPMFAPRAIDMDYVSVYSVPLRLRDEVIGALNLLSHEPGSLSNADKRLARALADVATIGILQQRAIGEAQESATALQLALTSRIRIEQAKGIVAERAGINVDEAFDRLRRHARSHQTALSHVAAEIVAGTLDLA